jgi:uncharacterized protein YgiM (DUF1202 family)
MRCTTFAALSLLLSAGAVAAPFDHAVAQDAPPPAPQATPQPTPEVAPPGTPQDAPPAAPQAVSPPAAQGAPPPAAVSAPAAPSSAVTHSSVNLRGGPGTNYALVRLIHAGSSVEVKECKDGWCQVVFEGANGYIIESSIAPNTSRIVAAKRRFRPMPGYVGPPPAYVMRVPSYYPPPLYRYYYYGPYYAPYWAWRRAYWRVW